MVMAEQDSQGEQIGTRQSRSTRWWCSRQKSGRVAIEAAHKVPEDSGQTNDTDTLLSHVVADFWSAIATKRSSEAIRKEITGATVIDFARARVLDLMKADPKLAVLIVPRAKIVHTFHAWGDGTFKANEETQTAARNAGERYPEISVVAALRDQLTPSEASDHSFVTDTQEDKRPDVFKAADQALTWYGLVIQHFTPKQPPPTLSVVK